MRRRADSEFMAIIMTKIIGKIQIKSKELTIISGKVSSFNAYAYRCAKLGNNSVPRKFRGTFAAAKGANLAFHIFITNFAA